MSPGEPQTPAPSRLPASEPEGSSEDGYPALILGRRSRRDTRLVQAAAVFAFLSLVFLFFGVPGLLSLYPEPVIHISDAYYTTGSDCTVFWDFILTNSGARDGQAIVTMYVDGAAFTNWTIFVAAHSYLFNGPSVFVSKCIFRSYGIAVVSVTPA